MPTILFATFAFSLALAQPALAHTLVRDYQFKQVSLKDAAAQGPDLKAIGGTVGDGKYMFAQGQGLELPKAGVTDHYTIELTFKFDDVESWQKILDFKKQMSDNGLYVYNGKLQFYDFAIGGDFQPNQEYRVRLERDRGTKIVRAFINDVQVWEFADNGDEAVLDSEALFLFVDDLTTTDETSGGEVTRVRVWDAPSGK